MKHHVLNPSPGTHPHAYGSVLGEEWLKPLIASLDRHADRLAADAGEVIILDLSGITTATASFLKATIVHLLRLGQRAASSDSLVEGASLPSAPSLDIYPCVSGLSDDVREELNEVLASQKLVCLEALAWNSSAVNSARLHGSLDSKLWETLVSLKASENGLTASQLHALHPGESINATAWNNRLADLYRLRLVRRTRQGRHWLYTSVAREVIRG